jgi:hypothetical protein
MAVLAVLCVVIGVVPGLVVPTLARLAPGATGLELSRHAGLVIPGTSLPTLGLLLALVGMTAALVRFRGSGRAAPAPTWACGQPVVSALAWTSAGFTKPLRLVLEALFRPRREIDVVRAGGIVQEITYSGEVPSLVDTVLYEPAIRAGLRGAARARRLQTGNVRTYALYLLVLVVGLLVLVRVGVLGLTCSLERFRSGGWRSRLCCPA